MKQILKCVPSQSVYGGYLCVLNVQLINLPSFVILCNSSDAGQLLGFRAKGQKRILETLLMEEDCFIKAWGQDPWAERAA